MYKCATQQEMIRDSAGGNIKMFQIPFAILSHFLVFTFAFFLIPKMFVSLFTFFILHSALCVPRSALHFAMRNYT